MAEPRHSRQACESGKSFIQPLAASVLAVFELAVWSFELGAVYSALLVVVRALVRHLLDYAV